MTVGEVLLEGITTGVINDTEMAWVAHNQSNFSKIQGDS